MTTETTTPVRRRGGPTKGDQREAQILEAARGLLSDRSVNDLTVDAIAKAAGVSRTAFYFYFPTKHAVVAAMLDGLWEEFGTTHAWLASTGPAPADLREHHRQTAAVWQEHREILTCTMGPVGYEPLVEWVEKARARYDQALAAKIRRDRAAGLATDGIDADALADMVSDLRTARFRVMARLTGAELEKGLDELTEVVLRMVYGSAPQA
ncbi:TetR/AcrR family transcriptional regulator [Nocardioides jiangxiensis]|uniref:TetR/AcrR family transcriptional regulator n=1 Tax=Nocardioides jiangxiensis TaxID=3064524 RepID=A0ABT9AZT0_9ACTN|nr:TetR/AcrR family transcriptional regulator [Nocardioides sp. WY-20]MDO7867970.1 TetR/AcrR family transcriptional regulator [Nocardioides sp. WY-20]